MIILLNHDLEKLETTYNAKIEVAGNTKVSKVPVDRDIFVYYIAGGHEFMFNKQNAFYYPEGTYTTQMVVSRLHKQNRNILSANTYFESAEDIIDSIMEEDDIDIQDYKTNATLKILKNIATKK